MLVRDTWVKVFCYEAVQVLVLKLELGARLQAGVQSLRRRRGETPLPLTSLWGEMQSVTVLWEPGIESANM